MMSVKWTMSALALGLAGCATQAVGTTTGQGVPAGPGSGAWPVSDTFTPQASLNVCPGMIASNLPPREADGRLIDYSPFIRVEGVVLSVAPVNGACLSSGFGVRSGKLHKGIDLFSREPIPIYAAADGRVLEAGYRDDYGYYAVIDHGRGVYTRYAHFSALDAKMNQEVPFGTYLGLMGNTASYRIPIHLHYEVLTGDYDTPKQSFGLSPVDPLSQVFVPAN